MTLRSKLASHQWLPVGGGVIIIVIVTIISHHIPHRPLYLLLSSTCAPAEGKFRARGNPRGPRRHLTDG